MPPKRKKHVNKSYKGTKEILFREDPNHKYAITIRALGDRRFSLICDDGRQRIGKLRGNMRRSEFVGPGTVLLVSDRMESDTKVDIFHKYPDTHVKMLTRYKELDDLNREYLKWQRENGLGDTSLRPQLDDGDDLVVFEDDDGDIETLIDTV